MRLLLVVVSTGSGANLRFDLCVVSVGSGANLRFVLVVVSTGAGTNLRFVLCVVSVGSGANLRLFVAVVSMGSGANFRGGLELPSFASCFRSLEVVIVVSIGSTLKRLGGASDAITQSIQKVTRYSYTFLKNQKPGIIDVCGVANRSVAVGRAGRLVPRQSCRFDVRERTL